MFEEFSQEETWHDTAMRWVKRAAIAVAAIVALWLLRYILHGLGCTVFGFKI